ncbi:hypothetical protein THC_0006 [Caldimicrobium thiodismutans]|uniref:histidine kinase n=1 Tax=Caldimicrobium thiodismutans TaxID=1653476 RepID=A0A0U5AV61_9BACT|nr:ATP-binding protein [Caldimicrobium thiodismutans]BAU22414.1 hypothetical protein THC_0006 [Caldimicrobium thiodismutans]
MFKNRLSFLKSPLSILTFIFILLFSVFTFFQLIYFKHYLQQSIKTKVENTLSQVEGKLSDYVRFLENFYKIPFIPEFSELPESKGWLLDLVDFLEELFKREKFLNLAIFYQKDPFLSWNFKEKAFPFRECKNALYQEGNLIKAIHQTKIENKEYCIFMTLDVSYYQRAFLKYAFLTIFFYCVTLVMVMYLLYRFHRAEEKKKEAEKRLQAEKELALLGRMAATLAHELRNNLNNLFLLIQTSSMQESAEGLSQKRILEELKGLLNWTQEILLFHKDIQLQPQFFDPESLLLELKLMVANLSSGKITFEIENRVNELWGDPFWLKKSFENLIKNACEALTEGGHIKLTLAKRGDFYIAELYDSGKPIPLEIKDKIFEPFFSTKKEGFGLGLYLIKKIIEAHQGVVEIENLKEGGKIFHLKWKASA